MRSPLSLFSLCFISHVLGAAAQAPATFLPNPNNAGGGGRLAKASAHFQVFNATEAQADVALKLLESAYVCFVDTLGWRSSGLSFNAKTDTGPWYKMNAYGVPSPASIGGAAGVMGSDAKTGASFIKVIQASLPQATVTVHEYGHALTYYEKNWVDQERTGTWWEPLAEFFADTYMTSPWCEPARKQYGQKEGRTIMSLTKVVGSAHQVLVDGSPGTGNHYQSWPFLAYLSYNPDKYPGLGKTAVRDMIRKYKIRSNETPLHALATVASPVRTQQIVGRYWARMANGDIGHPQGREKFNAIRAQLNFANLEPVSGGSYRVKEARKPKYMGANIIPLKGSGSGKISVKVTAQSAFTATLAIRAKSGAIRYVDLPQGAGEAAIDGSEQATLVVANTPANLVLYNGFQITPTSEVSKGLTYTLQLSGATV